MNPPPTDACPCLPGGAPPEGEECPLFDSTIIESKGQGTKGQCPEHWVSYRITTTNKEAIFDLFKGCCCVIAEEISKTGVQHYHIVVAGHEMYETVKKRIQRLKLGRAMVWSEKDRGEFLKAVSYTIKGGEYWTRQRFYRWVDIAPEYQYLTENIVADNQKDTDKDWMLTYNNLLRVTLNWRNKYCQKTSELGAVLEHMMENSRWVPSPMMIKSGLDPWYHQMFTYRCNQTGRPPNWWDPRDPSSYLSNKFS